MNDRYIRITKQGKGDLESTAYTRLAVSRLQVHSRRNWQHNEYDQ